MGEGLFLPPKPAPYYRSYINGDFWGWEMSQELKATPGPWEASVDTDAESDSPFSWPIITSPSGEIVGVEGFYGPTREEAEANANLSAAAHELYAALYAYTKPDGCTCDGDSGTCRYCVAEAALAKARGERV